MRCVGEKRRAVDLGEMKKENGLKGFGLFRQLCPSMVPVSEEVWKRVCEHIIEGFLLSSRRRRGQWSRR